VAKCESVFFCGELSWHPDENRSSRRKKREIAALETAGAKIELDLNWLPPE